MNESEENLCALFNFSSMLDEILELKYNLTCFDEDDELHYEPSNKVSNIEYASVSIYITFSFLALVGNVVVLRLLYKRGNGRTVFDVTVASLVFADLCTAIGFLASNISFLVFLKTGDVSESVEKFFDIFFEFTIFCFIASILHVILITAERLCALFFPLKYRQVVTNKGIRWPILIIWMTSLSGSLVHALVLNGKQSDKAIGIMIVVSSGILCVMYSIIAIKILYLKRRSMFKSKRDRIVLMNSLAVTISFLVCLLPLAFGLLGVDKSSKSTGLLSSLVAVKLLLDPLLYFYVSFWKTRRETKRRWRSFAVATFTTTSFSGRESNRGLHNDTNAHCIKSELEKKEDIATIFKSKEVRRFTKTMSKIYK